MSAGFHVAHFRIVSEPDIPFKRGSPLRQRRQSGGIHFIFSLNYELGGLASQQTDSTDL